MGTGYDGASTRTRITYDMVHHKIQNSSAWYVEDNFQISTATIHYFVISTATVGSPSSTVSNVRPHGWFSFCGAGIFITSSKYPFHPYYEM